LGKEGRSLSLSTTADFNDYEDMSAWRRLAIELFPERKRQIQDASSTFSIYALFFDLYPMTRNAHRNGDVDFLKRSYQFAEWVWQQKHRSGHVYNAVVVSFYEHLVNDEVTCAAIPDWVKPDIFEDIQDVFEHRLSADKFQALLTRYNAVNQTTFK